MTVGQEKRWAYSTMLLRQHGVLKRKEQIRSWFIFIDGYHTQSQCDWTKVSIRTDEHAIFVRVTGIFYDWNDVRAFLGNIQQIPPTAVWKLNSVHKTILQQQHSLASDIKVLSDWPASMNWIGLCSVLRQRQHSIGYMGDGFYRSSMKPKQLLLTHTSLFACVRVFAEHICWQHRQAIWTNINEPTKVSLRNCWHNYDELQGCLKYFLKIPTHRLFNKIICRYSATPRNFCPCDMMQIKYQVAI